MNPPRRNRRAGGGLVRTVVVGAATLAILLVCFSIYQYSQLSPDLQARIPNPRLPDRNEPLVDSLLRQSPDDSVGVEVGGARAGKGRNVSLSLYRPGGTTPFGEIAFHSWEPVDGVPDELIVVEPEIRLRTKDGHGIRVTAPQATLEGDLKGGLNLRRGRMGGGVLIEYDRLTAEDRASLPPPANKEISADQTVRIDVDELTFDLEYSKVSVPRGGIHLAARDIDFRADEMEIRFNEDEGLVEHIRIASGGRIELRELSDDLGLSIPSARRASPQNSPLVEWLRQALEAALAAQLASKATQPPDETAADRGATDNDVPLFRPDEPHPDETPKTIRYLAHFEENVDAKQWIGSAAQSRLQADGLEIFRALSSEDTRRIRTVPKPTDPRTAQSLDALTPRERILVKWDGRLAVDIIPPDDERWEGDGQTRITAAGSPVLVSNPDGDATCAQLTLDPESSRVWLVGTPDDPVVVRSAREGNMTGLEVYTQRTGDDLYVRVSGPGVLTRGADRRTLGLEGSDQSVTEQLTAHFDDQLEVHGHFVTESSTDITGAVSTKEYRALDRALFVGQVALRQGPTSLEADVVTITFGSAGRRDRAGQNLEHIAATGNVSMVQGDDRVTARHVDVNLTTDRDGQIVPLTATAQGDVEATQGDRIIRARDKLVVDFEMVSRPAPPFDAVKAHAKALEAGLNVAEIDWDARRRQHEAAEHKEVGVKRLHASADVSVSDPLQALDLTAAELECAFENGREIETARVTGTDGHPATVRLGTFTVTGDDVKLNVPDQWADVPGPGRMSFWSRKDLDGRKADNLIPISIEWQEWMKYQGRENRAVFSGAVHAYSRSTTEFDCEQLMVEFDEVAADTRQEAPRQDWWIFQDIIDNLDETDTRQADGLTARGFDKEPAYLLATGGAVVLTADVDPSTGKLQTRARLSGEKLSVDLRREVSKMLIESPGTLLLEDFRPAPKTPEAPQRGERGLFSIDESTGPSKTLIEWQEAMWYDFSIDQTRFEGNVALKHFSGARLERALGRTSADDAQAVEGRSTYLTCDVLTADFLGRRRGAHLRSSRRMGRLSAARLRQFQAVGSVVVQDETEGLHLKADRVVFERDRNILAIYGASRHKAQIWVQAPGKLPTHFSAVRMFYDMKTGRVEAAGTTVTGG